MVKYQYAYAIDGSTTDTLDTSKSWTRADFPNGTRTEFYVRAVDAVGNVGEWTEVRTIKLDFTAPTGTIVVDKIYGPYVNSNTVTANLTVVEDLAKESEIYVAIFNENEFSLDIPNNTIEWMPYEAKKTWEASPGDGIKRVYVIYKDAAGNQSIYLDRGSEA